VSEVLVRRATVEDLPQLIELWQMEQLPWADLEKRLTDFQVAEADGAVAGVLGLVLIATDGFLYGEGIGRPELADEMRLELWSRFQTLMLGHNVVRLWICSDAPFWRSNGFRDADARMLQELPGSLAGQPGRWRWLPLKEDSPTANIEKQFALLKALHQEENERIVRRARMLKIVLTSLVVACFGFLTLWAIYVGRIKPLLHRKNPRQP